MNKELISRTSEPFDLFNRYVITGMRSLIITQYNYCIPLSFDTLKIADNTWNIFQRVVPEPTCGPDNFIKFLSEIVYVVLVSSVYQVYLIQLVAPQLAAKTSYLWDLN